MGDGTGVGDDDFWYMITINEKLYNIDNNIISLNKLLFCDNIKYFDNLIENKGCKYVKYHNIYNMIKYR